MKARLFLATICFASFHVAWTTSAAYACWDGSCSGATGPKHTTTTTKPPATTTTSTTTTQPCSPNIVQSARPCATTTTVPVATTAPTTTIKVIELPKVIETQVLTSSVQALPPAPADTVLAFTGARTEWYLFVAAVLLGAGCLALLARSKVASR